MDEIKISVIMPVYRVENYVAKAIESILSQSLKEFEFWIVDDGSPDKSGAICDRYAAKDKRIHVIHKENGGAPSARNAAMRLAKGKYFFFLDADDWAERRMLEDMYNLAEQHRAQLVVCGFYIDTYYGRGLKKKYISEKYFVDDAVYEDAQSFRENSHRYFDRNLLYTPWNKLFLASYLKENDIFFPETFRDDFPFNIAVIRDVQRVVVSTKAYYHFLRAREESETTKFQRGLYRKREEEHGWMLDLYKGWGIENEQVTEVLSRRYIERQIECVTNLTCSTSTLTHSERIAEIRSIVHNPRVDECLKHARPKSLYTKLVLLPFGWKAVHLVWLEAVVITFVKEHFGRAFAKLRSGR
jgi:glycosyltransferase EpsJ